jgi:hypothetical protein
MAQKKKSDCCPLCGDELDLYCTGHRNTPFVDDKCYPRLCFTCYYVPKTEKQTYTDDGSVAEDIELPFSHKHLHTAEELVDGPAETLAQARRSVRAVRAAIKAAKLSRKVKPKKRPKDPGTQLL